VCVVVVEAKREKKNLLTSSSPRLNSKKIGPAKQNSKIKNQRKKRKSQLLFEIRNWK
jgi:hypothetical protein